MGAVRMRVQTADKNNHNNPQVIHTTPVYQLPYEVVLSDLGKEYAQICTVYKQKQSKTVLNKYEWMSGLFHWRKCMGR